MAKVTITLETAANITDAELADLMRESMAQGEIQSVYRDDDHIDLTICDVQEPPKYTGFARTIEEATHRYMTGYSHGKGYFDGYRYFVYPSNDEARIALSPYLNVEFRDASDEWKILK